MGVETALIAAAVVGAAGTAATIYNGQQQQKEMKKANDQAQESANEQLKLAKDAQAKADSKAPDVQAYRANNSQQAAAEGPASTMLTGPSGVDPSTLSLGKNTLLGM